MLKPLRCILCDLWLSNSLCLCALLQQMPPGSATHPYLMPSPMGYAYYNPQTVGSYSAIVPTYDAAAAACTIPVTMETSQMMGSNMQTIANGLTQQLFVAPSSLAKQLEVGNLICTTSPFLKSIAIPMSLILNQFKTYTGITYTHWHRLVKDIGGNQNIGEGQKVVITDERWKHRRSSIIGGMCSGCPPRHMIEMAYTFSDWCHFSHTLMSHFWKFHSK